MSDNFAARSVLLARILSRFLKEYPALTFIKASTSHRAVAASLPAFPFVDDRPSAPELIERDLLAAYGVKS